MKKNLLLLAGIAALAFSLSCGKKPPALPDTSSVPALPQGTSVPQPTYPQPVYAPQPTYVPAPPPDWRFEKDGIRIHLKSDPKLNQFQGDPHTLMICIYNL
ncbi:MAG TPA: hypothetical protein VLS90_20750, partial [Thermodesulfobacteriota bacterium]|nr:hypothetical protein [Thermodesulfobacteriota bacterium]